uniref:Uncharacterized protein n=1 Tax=Octactis speculum TaxID=3111310 RepID=A0A7S2BT24_9STRA
MIIGRLFFKKEGVSRGAKAAVVPVEAADAVTNGVLSCLVKSLSRMEAPAPVACEGNEGVLEWRPQQQMMMMSLVRGSGNHELPSQPALSVCLSIYLSVYGV